MALNYKGSRSFNSERSKRRRKSVSFSSLKQTVQKFNIDAGKAWINFIIGLSFFSIIIGSIIFFVFLAKLSNHYSIYTDTVDIEKTGQVGDFVGGIVGSIWSLTGVLLFFATLRLQSREFKENRVHFQLSRLTDVIYRQLEILIKHLDSIQLRGLGNNNNEQLQNLNGRSSVILFAKKMDILKSIQQEQQDDATKENFKILLNLFETNKAELLSIYEELGNHIDTIRAILIKEDIPLIDLNELKGIFFKNIGRDFLNSSENLLSFLDWYIDYKKQTDNEFIETGSTAKILKRKISSIKKFRHTHYDKETLEQYISRREMYNIHYF